MKCNVCGAATHRVDEHEVMDGCSVAIDRRCANGHAVRTHEVFPTMVADARELESALRLISRRRALFHRDRRIAGDPRPVKAVAAEYGLTEARVRQIRTAATQVAPSAFPWQQLLSNSERNEA